MAFRIRSAPHRRYVLRVGVAMGFYLLTLPLAIHFLRDGGAERLPAAAAWLLALLPGVSVAAVFWAVGRLLVEEQDEYQRMLLVRQSLFATGFTLSLVTIYGFLENFGMVGHVDAFYVAVLWFFGLGLGSLFNRLTIGGSGGC